MRRGLMSSVVFGLVGISFTFSSVLANGSQALIHDHPEFQSRLQQFKEEYVLLQFWSPFCAPCGEEVGELNSLLKTVNQKEKSLGIVGVPIRSRKKEMDAFISHFQPQYEQWVIGGNLNKIILSNIQSVPRTLLFDRQRKLIKEWGGKISANDILNLIQPTKYPRKEGGS